MRLRHVILAGAFVACAVLVRPSVALSPPDQYATFDRDTAIISDRFTGLAWQRTVVTVPRSAAAAATYCQGLSLDGTAGFRLPTYLELLSLVDDAPHYVVEGNELVPHAIDPNAFPDTPARYFWAADVVVDPVLPGAQQWSVDFRTGQSAPQGRAEEFLVRCVRSTGS